MTFRSYPASTIQADRKLENGETRLAGGILFHEGIAMGFLYWALFGLVAGILAKLLIPGNQPGGIIATTILGVLGACLGGWIGTQMGWGDVNGFDMRSMGLAVGGGIIVVLLYALLTRNR